MEEEYGQFVIIDLSYEYEEERRQRNYKYKRFTEELQDIDYINNTYCNPYLCSSIKSLYSISIPSLENNISTQIEQDNDNKLNNSFTVKLCTYFCKLLLSKSSFKIL
jgi:hypothetical protein